MNKTFPLRLGIALGMLSASVIASQLALMQILAIVQWHHFAYMVISIAMLGFGAAGTTIALFKTKLLRHTDTLLPVLAIAAGMSLELTLRLTNSEILAFDLYHLFIDTSQFWKLAASLIIYFLPFYFAALVIGLFFTTWVSQIGKLYFANLFGSGVGGLLALLVLSMMLPWNALSFCALFAMVSGLFMIRNFQPGFTFVLSAIVIFAFLLSWIWPYNIQPSQYKSLSKTMNLPDAEIIYQEPGIYGLNQVVTSPVLRYAPGIGLSYDGEIPVKPAVFTNGEFTGVLSKNWKRTPHPANYTTFALPFELGNTDTVLVLNGGTGYFAAHALRQGSQRVDVTEPNSKLVNLMQTVLADISDSLYNHDKVHLHTIEARTFLASSQGKYDLVILPVMDAFGGTSGLYAMQENYSLTVEGFNKMWQRLNQTGSITLSCWLDYPVRMPLKIATTLMEMLKQQSIAYPEKHIAMIKSWGTVTFVVSKSPFSEQQVNKIRSFCDSLFFDPVLLPGITDEERNRYNAFGDVSLFTMIDDIISGSKDYDDYAFYISPATDNQPYFNQFIRFRSLPVLSDLYNQQSLPFLELGYLIVFVTLLQVTVLALLFIIVPLFRLRIVTGGKLPTLLYFAALGLGYMFIEIILIQRFILYFGTPVISASLVIGIMMIASGVGSYVTSVLQLNRRTLLIVIALVIICGVLLFAGLNPLLRASSGHAPYIKIIITVLVIALPAFFMGMPFPLGLKSVSIDRNSLVPWAWGINGCLSVIASPLAILIAVEAGFTWVMVVAVMVYSLAFLVSGKLLLKQPI
jgi:hypothetical protein